MAALEAIAAAAAPESEVASLRRRLAVAQERMEDLARVVSDWIWEVDETLRFTFVSLRVSEVLGYVPQELIGRGFAELGSFANKGAIPFDPKRKAPFRDLPFRMRRKDGAERLFQISAVPMFCPESGAFAGFRGSARDITAETEAWDRAAQSRRQLIEAIESVSEAFALYDPADRLVLCNRKYREMLPHARCIPGAAFGDVLREAVEGGDIELAGADPEAFIAERLRQRSERRTTMEVRLAGGRWVRVGDRKTADGSTVGIRSDITEAKRREEALLAAKEMAEAANRSKSEFLANISHELRTPLNAIIGFSEVMRDEIFGPIGPPQYRAYLGDVLVSANHLLEVINDILDVAKAEAGKLDLRETTVPLARIVHIAARLVEERALRGSLTLALELPEELPPLFVDERKLKQILINLLTNAIKFTPQGGRITVGARFAEDGDLLVEVADTGIGIAPEQIATALAPFGQVDSRLSRRYNGTGLGLPLTRALVELHGGSLALSSELEKGTTVTVRLPASRLRGAALLAR
jgi:PAS domain S-box-containing protein